MIKNVNIVTDPKQKNMVKEIDNKTTNFATSWYIAMPSDALGKKPKEIKLFGQPLVAWRDCQGKPTIMSLYCSHLGASLAMGKVLDNCLQCPFHHWRYDPSGQCVSIPQLDSIPATARQTTYITAERYGYIWVWYGPQVPLFPLPKFPEAEDKQNYMFFRYNYYTTTTGLRAIENLFDVFHFLSLHELKVSEVVEYNLLHNKDLLEKIPLPIPESFWFGALAEFPLSAENHLGKLGSLLKALKLYPDVLRFRLDSWAAGCRMTAWNDEEERFKTLWCLTPVAENQTIVQTLGMIKKTGNLARDIIEYIAFVWQSQHAIGQDVPILNALKSDGGGAYVKNDRLLLKFREFYRSWIGKTQQ